MPYIKPKDRNKLLLEVRKSDYQALPEMSLYYEKIQTAGELQYAMALIFKSYIERKGLCYQTLNDVIGALSGADKEFYRQHVVDYEQKKIEENGDI